jgi:hypothetical protein
MRPNLGARRRPFHLDSREHLTSSKCHQHIQISWKHTRNLVHFSVCPSLFGLWLRRGWRLRSAHGLRREFISRGLNNDKAYVHVVGLRARRFDMSGSTGGQKMTNEFVIGMVPIEGIMEGVAIPIVPI